MKKTTGFLFVLFAIFLGYYLFPYWIPFKSEKLKDGWIRYSNDDISFEYPFRLFRDREVILDFMLTDGKYSIFYNHDTQGIAGIPKIEELISKEPWSYRNQILTSLKTSRPNHEEAYYEEMLNVELKFLDILEKRNKHDSNILRFVADNDTILVPQEIEATNYHTYLRWLYKFDYCQQDSIDSFSRKIYYDKIDNVGQLYLWSQDLDKDLTLSIDKIDTRFLLKENKNLLSDEDFIRVLNSVRIKD